LGANLEFAVTTKIIAGIRNSTVPGKTIIVLTILQCKAVLLLRYLLS
jgi:hypothetical protein